MGDLMLQRNTTSLVLELFYSSSRGCRSDRTRGNIVERQTAARQLLCTRCNVWQGLRKQRKPCRGGNRCPAGDPQPRAAWSTAAAVC